MFLFVKLIVLCILPTPKLLAEIKLRSESYQHLLSIYSHATMLRPSIFLTHTSHPIIFIIIIIVFDI